MKIRMITLLFIAVSLLDTFFTIKLLHNMYELKNSVHVAAGEQDDGLVVENFEHNPIARAILIRYGFSGMVIYKIVVICTLCIVVAMIYQHKPRVSFSIITAAFIITAAVAIYGMLGVFL